MTRHLSTAAIPVAAAVLFVCGCGGGKDQPAFGDLVPVAGVVLRSGKPVSGGVLEFNPEPKKDDFMINSEVGADGSFTLTTVRLTDSSGERKPGVSPGKYRVVYRPPLGDQTESGTELVALPGLVGVDKAMTDLKIELPKRRTK